MENARKLHAVKMIEKYYTWLNDEEVGILERMLEIASGVNGNTPEEG